MGAAPSGRGSAEARSNPTYATAPILDKLLTQAQSACSEPQLERGTNLLIT